MDKEIRADAKLKRLTEEQQDELTLAPNDLVGRDAELQALSRGLASLDEGAVAALGFEHLVFVRAAQTLQTSTPGSRLQRFALWWLQQLSWMVPPQQQPLRAAALARCVVQLVRGLPALPQGTRVIAPEQLWQWTQQAGGLDAALARGLPAEPSLHASP